MLLHTLCHANYEPLAAITESNKQAYADRWGHEFVADRHFTIEHIGAERAFFWRARLPLGSYMFFTGCDAAITNFDFDFNHIIEGPWDSSKYDLYICSDGNGPNADSWIMRGCPACLDMLDYICKYVWGPHKVYAHEQDAMACYLSGYHANRPLFDREGMIPNPAGGWTTTPEQFVALDILLNRSPVRVKLVDQHMLNAYPGQCYPHMRTTGSEPWSWKPGDFVAHCPGTSLETRIEFFKRVLA